MIDFVVYMFSPFIRHYSSDVRPILIFAISNSYVLLSLLNTLGKPEKLYCTGFGQVNAEIQRFEEH